MFSEAMLASKLRATFKCTDQELGEIVPDIAKLVPITDVASLEHAFDCAEWWQLTGAESWLCDAIEKYGTKTMECYREGIFYPRACMILDRDLNGAASAGYVDIVTWLMPRTTEDAERLLPITLMYSISCDHVDCATIIYAHMDLDDDDIMCYKTGAIKTHSIECLKYLHSICVTWEYGALEHAFVDNDNIDCINFALEHGAIIHENSIENAIAHKPFAAECTIIARLKSTHAATTRLSEVAAIHDNVDMLSTFLATGQLTRHCLYDAAIHCSIACINLLLSTPENRATQQIDHSLLVAALQSGNIKCMQKIWDVVPMENYTLDQLLKEEYLPGLKFAHTHGCELTEHHLHIACNYESLPTLQYLHDNGARITTISAHAEAALKKRVEIDQFRLEHGIY